MLRLFVLIFFIFASLYFQIIEKENNLVYQKMIDVLCINFFILIGCIVFDKILRFSVDELIRFNKKIITNV